MHWQTEQEKQALADFRAHNRRIRVLERELWELKLVQQSSTPEAGSWALQMIKSIEHELDQLQS
jgi:hypothetical protein